MPSPTANPTPIAVIGIGVASGLGHGKAAFSDGLFTGRNVFSYLGREGRQAPPGLNPFIGVEMPDPPEILPPRLARTATLSSRAAIAVLSEAWHEAGLDAVDPERVGLIVGGSNLMSRESALAGAAYADRLAYVPPRHGHMYLDTDIAGLCAATFPIRAFAHTVGAASASGAVAVIEAMHAIQSGRADVCIALGAMQDLSAHDLQAMRAMGAMGSTHFADTPEKACRPMDANHDGFIYGEASAALVLARADILPHSRVYGSLLGSGFVVDGTRGPEPSSQGQLRAARNALAQAGLTPADIDYVNGHATGTPAGDHAELETYLSLGLHHARFNATKSILGHGLSAAGAIEIAAVLLEIAEQRLHPTRNLEHPLDPGLHWVGPEAVTHTIRHALKFSFGFGGVNTALVIGAPEVGRSA